MKKGTYLELESHFKKSNIDYLKFSSKKDDISIITHWHNNIEILFINRGELLLTLGNNEFLLKKGDTAFISSDSVHSGISKSDDLEYEMIQVKYELLLKISEICDEIKDFTEKKISIVGVFDDGEIGKFCSEAKMLSGNGYISESAEIGFVCKLFSYLLRKHSIKGKANGGQGEKFGNVIEYINTHHTENLTVSELSKKFSFDTAYFSRKFKEIVGIPPSNYILSLRLDTAEKMLLSSDHSVEYIGNVCGFESSQYFIKCFKRKYLLSPLKYRNEHKKKAHQ